MKKLTTLLAVLCLLWALSLPALAADSPYILDEADLLTDMEEQARSLIISLFSPEREHLSDIQTTASSFHTEIIQQAISFRNGKIIFMREWSMTVLQPSVLRELHFFRRSEP